MISQTPWLERRFVFGFPPGIFPVVFSRLEGTIFRLYSLLSNADDEFCSHRQEGWSVKEHVGHLWDLEELGLKRMSDFIQNKSILTAADMTNKKTEQGLHNEKTLEQLVESFTIERQKLLEIIYGFDEIMLQRASLHPRLQQPMQLVDCLYFIAEHDDHHIARLSNLLRRVV